MAAPRDANEVEPTLLPAPAPARPGHRSDTPAHPAPRDATAADGTRASVADVPGTVIEDDDPAATLASGVALPNGRAHDTAPLPGSAATANGAPAPTGTMVGRFALKGLHASGGLGEVFTARDTELNREVAVKRIKSRYADDPGSRRRFLTEAELTARLDHPGVVPVFGLVNDARGRPVYAMRFIRGETLKDEIERYHAGGEGRGARGEGSEQTETEAKSSDPSLAASPAGTRAPEVPRTVAFRQLLSRFVAVCQAIAYAHEKGIIHRDIKPANVMVGKFGEVLVVDWGLAKSMTDGPDFDRLLKRAADAGFRHDPNATELPSNATLAGTAVGTPAYMAPEQAAGHLDKVGPKADVYSLGATLFAVLTGRAPFTGKSAVETLDEVRRGAFAAPHDVNAECPRPLDAVCRKAMALNPDHRYPSAQALAADVERWLSDEPVSAYPDPLSARVARWGRRHPAGVAAGVSLLFAGLLAAAGVALAIRQGEKETRKALALVTEKERETAAERDKVKAQERKTADALADVTKAKAETDAEKVKVAAAGEVARLRYDRAVAAYGTLVHDIDRKLGDRAGMQDIRRRLLLNATEGLQKLIAEKVPGDLGADRTLVAAHRQMGEVLQLVGEITKARAQFLEAERVAQVVWKTAAPEDAPAARRDLARSLAGLADVQREAGDTTAALDAINKAVELFGPLAADATGPAARLDLVAARARRAAILLERGDTRQAAAEYEFALTERRAFAKAAPDDAQKQRDLADSVDAMANVQLRTGDTNGATKSAAEGLSIRKAVIGIKTLTDQPAARRELAAAHAQLGDVHFDRGLMSAAATEYEAGIAVLTTLLKDDPQNAAARAELAALFSRLGRVRVRTGEVGKSLSYAHAARDLCEKLLEIDPTAAKAQRDLALAQARYGDALLAADRAKDARDEYDASREHLRRLEALDTGSAAARLEHARAWARTGDARLALADPKGAGDAFAASVDLLRAAEKKDPGSAVVRRELAVALYKQAEAYLAADKPSLAGPLARDATKLLVDLAALNPGSAQAKRDVALALARRGQIVAGTNHPTGVALLWGRSLDQLRELAKLDPTNVQALEEEAGAWERLAGFYAAFDPDLALEHAEKAVGIWKDLGSRADASTPAGRKRLALARVRCGDITLDVRRLPTAAGWYGEALKGVADAQADPLLAPVYALAAERLAVWEAVRVGLTGAQTLADKQYDAVRIVALRKVTALEVRDGNTTNAVSAAGELARVAADAADLFTAARALASCATSTRPTPDAKDLYAKEAVGTLKRAVGRGFRNADALAAPEWAEVGRLRPAELKAVTDELNALIAAGK